MVAFGHEFDELQLVAFFQSYRRYPVSSYILEAGGVHFLTTPFLVSIIKKL